MALRIVMLFVLMTAPSSLNAASRVNVSGGMSVPMGDLPEEGPGWSAHASVVSSISSLLGAGVAIDVSDFPGSSGVSHSLANLYPTLELSLGSANVQPYGRVGLGLSVWSQYGSWGTSRDIGAGVTLGGGLRFVPTSRFSLDVGVQAGRSYFHRSAGAQLLSRSLPVYGTVSSVTQVLRYSVGISIPVGRQ